MPAEMLRRRKLARDLFDSAELLYWNLKYRDSVPLVRRAVEESAIALALAAGLRICSPEEALRAIGEQPELSTLEVGKEVPQLIAQLVEIGAEIERHPLVVEASSLIRFRQLFSQAAGFIHESGRLVRVAARSQSKSRWRRALARLAGILRAVAAVAMVVWMAEGTGPW